MRFFSVIKSSVVSQQSKPRRILTGPFKDIVMDLTLHTQTQLYLGLFERETHSWLTHLSEGITTAVDVGVGHGEHTLFLLMKTHAERVYGFEPDDRLCAAFQENLRLNGMDGSDRVVCSPKCVGRFDTDRHVRLDSVLRIEKGPCLLKVDAEGAEMNILEGAQELNHRSDVRWLIETHSAELEIACLRVLRNAGFETIVIRTAWWRCILPEQRLVAHNRWLAAWK